MAKFYVSCTTLDLGEARKRVSQLLRSAGHEVVSMDEYTAEGRPPLAKCREDVEKSDVYLGIFAFRYGSKPDNQMVPAQNPENRAITELEYRHAQEKGKDRLVFLLAENALWPADLADKDRTNIDALRQLLSGEVSPMFFSGADNLLAVIGATLSKKYGSVQPVAQTPALPRVREIKHDVAIFCAAASDDKFAREVGAALLAERFVMPDITVNLFPPKSAEDFEKLEVLAREARSALVILSDTAAGQLAPEAELAPVVQTLSARTGKLVALCSGAAAKNAAEKWPRCRVLDANRWQNGQPNAPLVTALAGELRDSAPLSPLPTVGIPVMTVAMNATEAAALEADPQLIENEVGKLAFQQFTALQQSYTAMMKAVAQNETLAARYGGERESWKPFAGSNYTAAELIADVAVELNRKPLALESRLIRPQTYPFDVMLDPMHPFRPIYDGIFRTGCVVLADEFSLFHPRIRKALSSLIDLPKSQLAVVTISPLNPRLVPPYTGVEEELRRAIQGAVTRFEHYDPQSELMVGDERRLKRWLYMSLPQTLRALQNPSADPERLARMWGAAAVDPLVQSPRDTPGRLL